MSDPFVPGSVSFGDQEEPEEEPQVELEEEVLEPDPEPEPEPEPSPFVQNVDAIEAALQVEEEILGQRFDEAEGILYVVTNRGRKIAFDGSTATTLTGVPPAQ